jgi:hypothetical protein
MVIRVSCEICSEHLDERDLKKNRLKCWKCGWETVVLIKEDVDNPNWVEDMIDIWLPYD